MKLKKYLPGLDSYRGRYLYLGSMAFFILCSFAVFNWKYITYSSQTTQQHIIQRNITTQALNKIIDRFQLIKVQIYQFSLNPGKIRHKEISRSITDLIELTSGLDITLFDNIDSEVLNNFLVQTPLQLHAATLDFIQIRTDPDLWIPAIQVMTKQLFPVYNEVLTSLDNIIEDTNLYGEGAREIKIEFLQLKNIWLSTISELRLLTAIRMGIFDNSAEGIDTRMNNISLLQQLSNSKLSHIQQLLEHKEYPFIREHLFIELKENIKKWNTIHAKVTQLLIDNNWRKDIPALKKIENLMTEFSTTLLLLSNELQKQATQDIQSLDENNRAYSFFFLLLGILLLIILIIIYFYIDRNILLPIARTTRAMLAQARGMPQELQISSNTSETRNLIEAFNQMSEKVIQRETRLDFIAHHDNLTKLPNRLMFNERLMHAILLTQRSERQVALMILDLDRFKMINDTLGHLFGDKLLQQTAQRLKDCIRAEDTIARLGGDEFAIILENINSNEEVDIFAQKIITLFASPFFIDDQEIHTSTSIGIALAPVDSSEPNTLIRYADIAMYQSKNTGRNQYSWFSEELEHSDESIINFENSLRDAIKENQFELHYQPIIDTQNESLNYTEALLRWNNPTKGLMLPDEILKPLDNTEILFAITCWVIQQVQIFQSQVQSQTGVRPCISINLPYSIFQLKQYRDRIEQVLLKNTEHPDSMVLEVTEDTLITDIVSTAKILNNLHQVGFRIALDDFGTGQSSLQHLRAFPIDIIKIDREFIRDVSKDINDENLVTAIISLGHDLNMSVIAEGVETQQQFDFLKSKNCHLFQGFYFARPMTSEDYVKSLLKKST